MDESRAWAGWPYTLILTVIATLVIALAYRLDSRRTPPLPVTLYIMWEPQAQFVGYYIARDRGFFRDEGLEVAVRPDLGVGESFFEILSRPHVYAINILSNTMEWLGENPNFAVISVMSKGCNMGWLSRGPKQEILKRMETGHFYSWWGSQDTLLKNLLIEHGIYRKDFFSRVNVGTPDLHSPDWLALVMKYNDIQDYKHFINTEENYISYCELNQPIFEDVLVGRIPRTPEEAEVNRKMARAIWRAWDWALAHPRQAIDHLMTINPRRARPFQESQLRIFGASLSTKTDVISSFPEVKRTLSQLVRNGLIKNAANVEGLFSSLNRQGRLRELGID